MGQIRQVRGSFQVDFYLGEYRFRKNLKTENEAHYLLNLVKNKIPQNDCAIKNSINLYLSNVTRHKSVKSQRIDHGVLDRLHKYMQARTGEEKPLLSQIEASHVEMFRKDILDSGVTNNTVNRYFNTIKHYFKKCEEWGFIVKSPAKFIRALPNDERRRSSWTIVEVELARKALNQNERDVFDFIYHTGCRLSQALELKKQDVDIVNLTLQLKSKKGPNAKEKKYFIPIPHQVLHMLKVSSENKSNDDYIFVDKNNKPFSSMLYSKNFKRSLKRNKIKADHLTLHGLRHFFASRLSKIGAPLNDIRLLLGHSSTKVTEGYIHSNIEELRKYLK